MRSPDEAAVAATPGPVRDDAGGGASTATTGELLTATALVAIGVVFYLGSGEFTAAAGRWPALLGALLAGLGVVNLAVLVRQRLKAAGPASGAPRAGTWLARVRAAGYARQLGTCAFVLCYGFVGYGFGFLAATAILVPIYMVATCRPQRPWATGLTTVGLLVFLHVIFGSVLNAPLERGAWAGIDLSWLPF